MQQINRIRYFFTLLLAAFPVVLPYPVTYVSAAWFLVSLAGIIAGARKITRKQVVASGLLSLPFLLISASALFYPTAANTVFWTRSFFLLLFPVGMVLYPEPFTVVQLRWIKRSFMAGTLAMLVFFYFWWLLFTGNHYDYGPAHGLYYILRTEFNAVTKVHPGYASMYIGLAMIFALDEWKQKKKRVNLWLLFFLLMVANLLLLMARLPLLVSGLVVMAWFFRQERNIISPRFKWSVGLLSVVVVVLLFIAKGSRFREFSELKNASLSDPHENTLLVRKGIYRCSAGLFKEHILTGTGPGQVQEELDNCFARYDASVFSRQHYNTHNQYLDYGISYGIGGLIILLAVLFAPFFFFRQASLDFLLFQVLIIGCMLGENILSRQAGLVFYCFFSGLYWLQETRRKI